MSDTKILVPAAEARRIPDWLSPHKNEWRSAGMMAHLIKLDGQSFGAWFQTIKPRLRCTTEPAPNKSGTVTRYLVKQVWACGLAHNVRMLPAMTAAEINIEALQQEITRLSTALRLKGDAPIRYREIDGTRDHLPLLRAMLRATDPRPLPGVYFLMSGDGEVHYVGQSQNVLGRMSGHISKAFETVKMIHAPDPSERLKLEARLIALFAPRDNVKGMERRQAA